LKVWHLLSNRWNSAITEYALSAARALEAVGHRSLFSPLVGSPAEKRAKEYGIETVSVGKFSLEALPTLRTVQRQHAPDVAIAYGGPETFLLPWIRGSTKTLLVRFRGHGLGSGGLLADPKQRFSLRRMDLVLTPSERLVAEMRERCLHGLIQSATLGCDTRLFFRKSLGVNSDRPDVVIFGRFDPVKGHREFMALFAKLLRDYPTSDPKPVLHIVGQPANVTGKDLRIAGEALGLKYGSDLRITEGRVQDVASLMSGATVGVVSSLGSEVICRVAEEFLLCGTPVVTSDVGSLKEVFKEESFGSVYSLTQMEHAVGILRNWIDRSWNESAGEKVARAQLAKTHFSLETMGQRLSHLLSAI
jgi:glycosyltransferase involved in cell wall biosynthesis